MTAPLTTDITHIMNSCIITFFAFIQPIFESGLVNHNPMITKPIISAEVPKIAWEQTLTALSKGRVLISVSPLEKVLIITIKIRIAYKTKAIFVRQPWVTKFFFTPTPLTKGIPKINKKSIIT
jgi:hypothetical protein